MKIINGREKISKVTQMGRRIEERVYERKHICYFVEIAATVQCVPQNIIHFWNGCRIKKYIILGKSFYMYGKLINSTFTRHQKVRKYFMLGWALHQFCKGYARLGCAGISPSNLWEVNPLELTKLRVIWYIHDLLSEFHGLLNQTFMHEWDRNCIFYCQ